MSKKEFIAMGATDDDVELLQWYMSNGAVALIKFGIKESDGWLK